jgi:hypothetical protein
MDGGKYTRTNSKSLCAVLFLMISVVIKSFITSTDALAFHAQFPIILGAARDIDPTCGNANLLRLHGRQTDRPKALNLHDKHFYNLTSATRTHNTVSPWTHTHTVSPWTHNTVSPWTHTQYLHEHTTQCLHEHTTQCLHEHTHRKTHFIALYEIWFHIFYSVLSVLASNRTNKPIKFADHNLVLFSTSTCFLLRGCLHGDTQNVNRRYSGFTFL